jgi:hypothetical protein
MSRWMNAAGVAVTATIALPTLAAAEQSAPPAARDAAREAPVKDCTRFNGRHGYYGNPWCTPEEQERWDKWEAERLRAARTGLTPP